MINGAHFLLYSTDPAADEEVLAKILSRGRVPAGGGRVILELPPAEIATHDSSDAFSQRHADRDLRGAVLYLMCDDLRAETGALRSEGVECTRIEETEFGLKTTIVLPSGGQIGLYQPSHPTAIDRGPA